MTDRCQRGRKMMCRGAKGGCSTEEETCSISRVPAKIPAVLPESIEEGTLEGGVDVFTQALKALCERSPFDGEEVTSVSSVLTLPRGLASLLSKHVDSRKKHKKSHASGGTKLSKQGRRSSIWVETEDCFREVTLSDIQNLLEVSTFRSLSSQNCFTIPSLGKVSLPNVDEAALNNAVSVKDEPHLIEIGNAGTDKVLPHVGNGYFPSQSLVESSSLEWILGSKNRILLTSERPSKKRKLLGSDAGLEKLLVSRPYEGNLSICHFCSRFENDGQLNELIVCSSCKVAVHKKCYGVQALDEVEPWLCSWCKNRDAAGLTENALGSERPCVFCPKKEGALKATHKSAAESGNGRSLEFAHLFCSLWMPEVYVENTGMMEPIMNVGGIKETRKKLICNICKVKCGACVRCSNGACRTSFHPICAREASHRLEVWGMFGCDNIELRAFCSKHSELQNMEKLPGTDANSSCITSQLPLNKPYKLKIGNSKSNIETTTAYSDSHFVGTPGDRSSETLKSGNGDANQLVEDMDNLEKINSENIDQSSSRNFSLVLKKLIDQGKINVIDVALEVGMTPDSLASTLADNHLVPELQCKIVKWLKNNVRVGTFRKNLKLKIKSKTLSEAGIKACEDSYSADVPESDNKDHVTVKSIPLRKRKKSNIVILKDEKRKSPPTELCSENGMKVVEVKIDQSVNDAPDESVDVIMTDTTEKMAEPAGSGDSMARKSPKYDAKPSINSKSEINQAELATEQNIVVDCDGGIPTSSVVEPVISNLVNAEGISDSYVHPSVAKKLKRMHRDALVVDSNFYLDGLIKKDLFPNVVSSGSIICNNHQSQNLTFPDLLHKHDEVDLDQLMKATNMEIPEFPPKDEVEGELIYFQHKLLSSAVNKKRLSDGLMSKVVKSLPNEIDTIRNQRWDTVLANKYLYELREAKKQGRKERRHKEAQALLAAATAAAASSSRISSFRKDGLDESSHQENLLKENFSSGRDIPIHSQPMPRPRETNSRVAVSRVLPENILDTPASTSDISKEHPRSCDICRRSETILNAILVCSSCKVAVHLDCYRSVKGYSLGPWHCELCEELLSSESSRALAVNSWEKPLFSAECGICGGTNGAFRKSTDGQWIHAYCAEWVFESTFKRGQVNLIDGMETVVKGNDSCCVCRLKKGVCIKCNSGHCQSTFHPSCARTAGFYMDIRAVSGKLQHKAYCEKHSLEQRNKADTQKHGMEELKNVKLMRVELERLRLLCERIVKREKLKRECLLSTHGMLALQRDTVAYSASVLNPFSPTNVSSESATTSLKGGNIEENYKSGSEAAIQRSDDDSSTLLHHMVPKRSQLSGKQIPLNRSLAARNLSRKHTETFEKELVMTSDQASMKNQRLPKGFVYVPIGTLSNDDEKKTNQGGSRSGDKSDHDG